MVYAITTDITMRSQPAQPHSSQSVAFMILSAVLFTLITSACRPKDDTINGPGPGPGGSWSVVLDTSSTLYVPNDTVSVRLFSPDGSLATEKVLKFEATISVDSISQFATTRDTVGAPWGTQIPVYYWGTGDTGGQESRHELINVIYIDLQTHDTLARTSRSYLVADR